MLAALLVLLGSQPNWKPWMLGPFVREDSVNPVLRPDAAATFFDPMRHKSTAWRRSNVFNPAAAVREGKFCLLFRAEDDSGEGIGGHTSRIGLAESADGFHFKARSVPVLFPTNDAQKPFDWPGGCEDPRVISSGIGYVMTYTTWNRKTARLSVATSPDLIHWHKYGPAFGRAMHGKWINLWSKSGAIVTQLNGAALEATKIDGKYWMYFGDKNINLATSENLVDWTPVTNSQGEIKTALAPRPGHFDSDLCESGPPAVITPKGIVLLYNARNGDPGIATGDYEAGQALFSRTHPDKVLDRTDTSFMKPERPFERTGQYRGGTVFLEGLAWFKGSWILAYGAADSVVGLARSRRRK